MNHEDALDAMALITAAARHDQAATEFMLDQCDNRAVAEVLARWCAGWLLDAVALSNRDESWWMNEVRSWAQRSDGGGWPWQV